MKDEQNGQLQHVVRKSIPVALDQASAFRLWTERIHTWWPTGHSRSGDAQTTILMECRLGGRFYERTTDGTEYEWGRITEWEPPHHLAYSWYLGTGASQPTVVTVRFVRLDEQRTRVEVEHRGPELIGELWWVNNSRYSAAWDVVLPAFAATADG